VAQHFGVWFVRRGARGTKTLAEPVLLHNSENLFALRFFLTGARREMFAH